MSARVRHGTAAASYVTSTVWAEEIGIPAQNVATILKPFVPNPHLTPFANGATCCWDKDCGCTIPHSQYSPPSTLKFFLTPPSPPPFSSPLTCTQVTAQAIIILAISGSLKNSNFHRIYDPSKNMYKNIFANLYSTVLFFFKLLFLYYISIIKTL